MLKCVSFLFLSMILLYEVKAQTGYFKTATDFETQNLVAFEDVSFMSSAFGCNVKFFKNDKKEEKHDQHDIFGFVDHGSYYRFYKYAIIHMMMRGEISFFGLVPTTLSFDEKKKIFTVSGTDKMLLFVSVGPSGELVPMKKKKLLELVKNDEEVMNLYKTKEIDFLNCILLYNIRHPTPDAFVMDKASQMSFEKLVEQINAD